MWSEDIGLKCYLCLNGSFFTISLENMSMDADFVNIGQVYGCWLVFLRNFAIFIVWIFYSNIEVDKVETELLFFITTYLCNDKKTDNYLKNNNFMFKTCAIWVRGSRHHCKKNVWNIIDNLSGFNEQKWCEVNTELENMAPIRVNILLPFLVTGQF